MSSKKEINQVNEIPSPSAIYPTRDWYYRYLKQDSSNSEKTVSYIEILQELSDGSATLIKGIRSEEKYYTFGSPESITYEKLNQELQPLLDTKWQTLFKRNSGGKGFYSVMTKKSGTWTDVTARFKEDRHFREYTIFEGINPRDLEKGNDL